MPTVSLIIPAHDESATIATGLRSIADQDFGDMDPEVLVMANGCSDDTVGIARSMEAELAEHGIELRVFDIPEAGKTRALNVGDAEATGDVLFYCDADVSMAPGTISAMVAALDEPGIALVSACQHLVEPRNRVVRGWARCYHVSPFQRGDDVVGGLYALFRADRQRFGEFPDVTADDRYLSLNFEPTERRRVPGALIEVRYTDSVRELIGQQARWATANAELDRRYPALATANPPRHGSRRWPYFVHPRPTLLDMACYVAIMAAARWRLVWRRSDVLKRWARARPR